jgi:hypothetical protein
VNTELRRRDLAERDGTLVRPDVVRQAMRSGVSAMRGTGDRLVRQFGNEAGEIYNEGVMRTPRLRTLAEFAEQEIILPDGPYAGRRFRLDRHPVARLLFDELDSGRWQRAFVTGPNQDGKSLLGFVIPTMYLLFERRETVILGVPTLDMWRDKWRIDLLPVIKASRYKDLLPSKGGGSREGDSILFEFRNGAHLRFMTGGGDDQSRAASRPRTWSSPRRTASTRSAGAAARATSSASSSGARSPSPTEARVVGRVHRQHRAGPHLAGVPARHRTAASHPLPALRRVGHPRARALHRLAGRESETRRSPRPHRRAPRAGGCGPTSSGSRPTAAPCSPTRARRSRRRRHGGPPPQTNTLGFRWTVVNSGPEPRAAAERRGRWSGGRSAPPTRTRPSGTCASRNGRCRPSPRRSTSQLDAFAIMRRTLPKHAAASAPTARSASRRLRRRQVAVPLGRRSPGGRTRRRTSSTTAGSRCPATRWPRRRRSSWRCGTGGTRHRRGWKQGRSGAKDGTACPVAGRPALRRDQASTSGRVGCTPGCRRRRQARRPDAVRLERSPELRQAPDGREAG